MNAILEAYGMVFPIAAAALAGYCLCRIPDLLNEAIKKDE